jgi:hypothetical protein
MAYGTPIILLNISSEYFSDLRTKTSKVVQKVGTIGLIFISLSSLTWMNDWINNRSFNLETREEFSGRVLDKYDVLIVGDWATNVKSIALLGDVRYFFPDRGFGISVERSKPTREISYIIPSGQCVSNSCLAAFVLKLGLQSPKEFELIYRDKEVSAFIGRER